MTLKSAGDMFNIVREISLGEIKGESEARFRILLVGEAELTHALALTLSAAEGKEGVHPWLEQTPTLNDARQDYDLAILVTEEQVPANSATLETLKHNGIPRLMVIAGSAAAAQVGAALPRPLEDQRLIIPNLSDADILKATLVPALLASIPADLKLSLARHLPPVRSVYMASLVEETARANAFYSASSGLASIVPILNIPLNVADVFVLTKNQLVMAYKLALAADKSGQPQSVMTEIIGVIGGGFFFRQVAREMVGLIPVWGIIPNIAVSYAGTLIIGRAVTLWATEGKRLSVSEMRRYYGEALAKGRALAETMVTRVKERRAKRLHAKRQRRIKAALDKPKKELPAEDIKPES